MLIDSIILFFGMADEPGVARFYEFWLFCFVWQQRHRFVLQNGSRCIPPELVTTCLAFDSIANISL